MKNVAKLAVRQSAKIGVTYFENKTNFNFHIFHIIHVVSIDGICRSEINGYNFT